MKLIILSVVFVSVMFVASLHGGYFNSPFDYPIMPDPSLTPGMSDTNVTATNLKDLRTGTVRNVPESVKRKVFQLYKIDLTKYKTGDFEVDHLVSLELGGSNDILNLWPQPYFGPVNAHHKDQLENRLHKMIVDGKISPVDAQKQIATNWVKAYEVYFGTNLLLGLK